jgi:hypothetical protein
MMKRNKIITSLMAALLISSMLTACGGQSEQTTEVPEEDVPATSEVQETEEETEVEEPETEVATEEPEVEEETEPEVTEEETEAPVEETTEADAGEESGSADFSDYNSAYLSKVTEYNDNGTADNFALLEVSGVGTPVLAAANSEGPLEEEGNAHIFIAPDGNLSELLSVSEGYDGNHIYISDNGTILWTSGMSGTEIYTMYIINGSELEITNELIAYFDTENETYTYRFGETEITEAEYQEKFAELISENSPYTGVDHDGLNKVNISLKDGYVDFEKVSTDKYLSFDEIKAQLEK